VALTREQEVQRLAVDRVIVRDEDGRRALSSFRFLAPGSQIHGALTVKDGIDTDLFGGNQRPQHHCGAIKPSVAEPAAKVESRRSRVESASYLCA